jgi:hypothetical protein
LEWHSIVTSEGLPDEYFLVHSLQENIYRDRHLAPPYLVKVSKNQ